jgi:hypothetical protein
MANWRACIPSNPLCEGAHNQFCVNNVSVALNEGVTIKVQVIYQNSAFATEFLTISGDEYKEWGQDDNWIYQKVARKLCLGVLTDSVDASGNPVQYIPAPTPTQDDNRSVHNPSDIETIITLRTELDEQKKKIESIMGLLVKSGSL